MSAVHLEPLLVSTPFQDCFIVDYDALYHSNNNDPTLLLQKLEEASNQAGPIIIIKLPSICMTNILIGEAVGIVIYHVMHHISVDLINC